MKYLFKRAIKIDGKEFSKGVNEISGDIPKSDYFKACMSDGFIERMEAPKRQASKKAD